MMTGCFPKGTCLLFFLKNQIQKRFAALRSDCDILLLEDKSMQKLLSLKRARMGVCERFDDLNIFRRGLWRPSGGKELACGSNSFSTIPMGMGLSACS